MPTPRKALIAVEDTPFYHCMSRCVRRAYLCGIDKFTGKNYAYRRVEIEERLLFLGTVFAIDICAYAIMSNHHHETLHINPDKAKTWDDAEVIRRWHQLFSGNHISQCFENGSPLDDAQRQQLALTATLWREQLTSISWFMRCLNEPVARKANKEDGHTGKFFEARFKSQALLDSQALISCIAYIDLNPIRAGIAETPEDSDHTSIKKRIQVAAKGMIPTELMPFQGAERKDKADTGLPFSLKDYVELIEWTGRIIHPKKSGFIPAEKPPILQRLKISPEEWIGITEHFEDNFSTWIGNADSLERCTARRNMRHTAKSRRCRQAFAA